MRRKNNPISEQTATEILLWDAEKRQQYLDAFNEFFTKKKTLWATAPENNEIIAIQSDSETKEFTVQFQTTNNNDYQLTFTPHSPNPSADTQATPSCTITRSATDTGVRMSADATGLSQEEVFALLAKAHYREFSKVMGSTTDLSIRLSQTMTIKKTDGREEEIDLTENDTIRNQIIQAYANAGFKKIYIGNPLFNGLEFSAPMTGGANGKGKHAGKYKKPNDSALYFVKRDTKKNPRVEKVAGEFIGGKIHNSALKEYPDLSAQIDLLKTNCNCSDCKSPGGKTYIQSKGFANYQGDLWQWMYEIAGKPAPKSRPRHAGTDNETKKLLTEALTKIETSQGTEAFNRNFAQVMATSLLIGDFDVHIGNLGVIEKDGKYCLVRLDFGGALRDLPDEVHPHSHMKHLPIKTLNLFGQISQPTNHFREYPRKYRITQEMAEECERIADVDFSGEINQAIEALGQHYEYKELIKIAEHIGMKNANKHHDKNALLAATEQYLIEKMQNRQHSLKRFAFEIRLSLINTINGIDENSIYPIIQKYEQFAREALKKNDIHLRDNNENIKHDKDYNNQRKYIMLDIFRRLLTPKQQSAATTGNLNSTLTSNVGLFSQHGTSKSSCATENDVTPDSDSTTPPKVIAS